MQEFSPLRPKVVLAVGAHADDIDFGAAGALAKFAADGAAVQYLVVTDGSKGSADLSVSPKELIAQREAEQRAAAKTIGAQGVTFLSYEDGQLEVSMALKKDIVRVIRRVKPDTLIVLDPSMIYVAEAGFINHPDHRAAGQATLDAVFPLARDHLSFPELLADEKLAPHKVAHLLLINLEKQNYYVDISDVFEQRLSALLQHVSQIPDQNQVAAMIKSRAATLGRKTGSAYAEGFIRIDLPG